MNIPVPEIIEVVKIYEDEIEDFFVNEYPHIQ
jgi:hypothetical protein